MKENFLKYELVLSLKKIGFNEPCLATIDQTDYVDIKGIEKGFRGAMVYDTIDVPLYQEVFDWFVTEHGLYHSIVPEFYKNGINFNWQILWYLPKEEWKEHIIYGGTMWYGDNGEYPTHRKAELGCILKMIEIVRQKSK